MVKKICPQCRSKRFTKNSTGSYVCESGHVYAGYQEEEGEFDATMGTARYRRMKGPKRKRKDPLAGQLVGIEDEKATLQAVQLILRHQLWWLVHEKGFPKEIQSVAREYWAACLMNFRRYQDHDLGLLQPTTNAQEPTPEIASQVPELKSIAGKKSHKKSKDGLDSMAEFQEPDSDTSSEDEDSDNQLNMEGEEKDGEGTSAPSQTEARGKPKTPRKTFTRGSGDRYHSAFNASRPLERDPKSWINTLPKEQSWMRSLDIFDRLQAQVTIPTALGETEDIARVNSDLYGEFCKSTLMSVPEESYQSLLRPFAATEYSRKEQHLDGSGERKVPGIDAFIRHLYMTVPPPQDAMGRSDSSVPPPLRPGEGYVYYIPDPSETYLGHYGRLLGHVGNIMATSVAEIERNVQIVEELLFTNINTPAKVASVNSVYANTPKMSKKKKKQPKIPEPLPQEYT
ncbi:Pol I core factor CF [Podila clonocystis]|nr:Pol I core factor CF [Podila clonocystis]